MKVSRKLELLASGRHWADNRRLSIDLPTKDAIEICAAEASLLEDAIEEAQIGGVQVDVWRPFWRGTWADVLIIGISTAAGVGVLYGIVQAFLWARALVQP